uniref:Uncharacterized protein n=1 Tax=Physcomitrium patens TaxID=3218 RepID=A0A2K1JKU1_PHYPA|nr:hypothetical protein PHYPA_017002 [Physcomitrium patens]
MVEVQLHCKRRLFVCIILPRTMAWCGRPQLFASCCRPGLLALCGDRSLYSSTSFVRDSGADRRGRQ